MTTLYLSSGNDKMQTASTLLSDHAKSFWPVFRCILDCYKAEVPRESAQHVS